MKICMFTNTYLPHVGGVANSVARFTEDLRRRGHRVMIIAPSFPDVDEAKDRAEDVFRVPAVQNFNGSDFSLRIPVPFVIDDALNEFDPDIIHSHHPYLLGDAAMRAAGQRCLPLVFTHHTRYEEYTHYVTSASSIMKQFAIHLSTEYANRCTRIVAPSRSIAKMIHERGVFRKVAVIPTGVDLNFFQSGNGAVFRKEAGISPNARVIGHVGRLAPEKNLEYLSRAVVRYLQRDPRSYFIVAGEGPSHATMQTLFDQNDLGKQVVMAGKRTGRQLADFYDALDIFIFASQSETQGMVLAEAMAAGKPVVGLNAPGVREIIRDGENGCMLAADSSPDLFAEAIHSIDRNPEVNRKMRIAAGRTARRFSRTVSAQQLEALYASILKNNNSHFQADDTANALEELQARIKVEWDLLTEKAAAIVNTIQSIPEDAPPSGP